MKITEKILIVDFGGQYNQLIARRVRDLNVYSDIVPASKALDYIRENKPIGIIFTGGPNSVYEEKAPLPPKEIFNLLFVFYRDIRFNNGHHIFDSRFISFLAVCFM